jgi:putative ABC transport system substrate-binding protein
MKDKLTTASLIATVLVLMLVLCLGSFVADAQQPTPPRIGWLAGGSPPAFQHITEAFLQGMREHGYIDGQNFVLEIRAAEGRFERLPGLAADLVRSKVAVILVGATGPLQAAKDATNTIPIVMASVGDPVGTGFIVSLERPGGNITGVAGGAVPRARLLELIKEAFPTVSRLAVLANPGEPGAVRVVKDWQVLASAAGIEARPFEVDKPDGFEEAFAGMARARADALVVVGDALMFSSRARIVSLAAKNRLPAMYPQKDYVSAGGLISYGTDLTDVFRRSAGHVDKILKGANPAELVVELPTKYELAINLATAKTLGLTIPASLRAKGDVLVE